MRVCMLMLCFVMFMLCDVNVYMYVVYACMPVCMHVCMHACRSVMYACMCVMCVCLYVMCVCLYVNVM